MLAKFYEASKCSSLSLFQYSKSSTCFLPSILSTFRWGDLNSMKHYSSPHTHWLEALIFIFKKTNEYTLVDTIFQNMAPMEISIIIKKKALGCERIGNSWYSREKKKKKTKTWFWRSEDRFLALSNKTVDKPLHFFLGLHS